MALLTNINGKFSVSDAGAVTFNDAFTFPTADGTANYVLKTNGSGQLAWAADNDTDYDYWILQGDSSANININSTNILKFVGGTYMDANATWAGGSYPRKLTINHENTSRSDTTSTDAPAFGGTFEAVTSVTTNATGHVTAIDVSTVTIPSDSGYVTGSGTLNKVVRWTATGSTVGDGPITFATNDSIFAGNVGIGITPSASFSGVEVLQLGKGMTIFGNTNDDRATMASNLILNTGTAFEYVMDGLAGKFSIEDGNMSFGTAPSGTAGSVATITERFAIANTGNATFAGDVTLSTGKSLYLSSLRLVHDGSNALFINQTTGDIKIQNSASDKDIIFKGLDGASSIDALTLDMSNGGSATFRDDIDMGGSLNMTGSSKVIKLNDGGFIDFDGTNLQFNTQRNPNTGGFHNTAKSHAHIGLQGANGGSQIIFGTAAANNTVATTRMTINADGTTKFNANILVDVINNSANSANIIYRSGTSTLVGGGTTANKLYVLDNGKVGISEDAPGTLLSLKGAADTSIITLKCTKNDFKLEWSNYWCYVFLFRRWFRSRCRY